MIKEIYIDLDGVLFDFDRQLETTLGRPRAEISKKELWATVNAYPGGWFRNLPLMPYAIALYSLCVKTGLPVTVLTATGNNYADVTFQKQDACWKRLHIPQHKIITVQSGILKANLASPYSLLIDDTPKVINAWREAGGIGILHTDGQTTAEKLKKLLTY